MDKHEADNIAWAIVGNMPDDPYEMPDGNKLLDALAKIVKENRKVWDAILRYDNGRSILCGLCGEDYVSVDRGVPPED